MTIFHAVIFGIVEGITEFLPISSTGHLILTAKLLKLSQDNFLTSFEIAIQLGAIFAVVLLYGKKLLTSPKVFALVTTAFIPTAGIGFIFYKIVKNFLLQGESIILWTFFLGGIFLILFEWGYREKTNSVEELEGMTYTQAFWIGVFQSIAMIPGVSRAAATICGGLFLGLKRKPIVEFSFLLAIPTMLAATAFDLLKNGSAFSHAQWDILGIGFSISFAVAIPSVKFLLHLVRNHGFTAFGIYRIAVALLFWIF